MLAEQPSQVVHPTENLAKQQSTEWLLQVAVPLVVLLLLHLLLLLLVVVGVEEMSIPQPLVLELLVLLVTQAHHLQLLVAQVVAQVLLVMVEEVVALAKMRLELQLAEQVAQVYQAVAAVLQTQLQPTSILLLVQVVLDSSVAVAVLPSIPLHLLLAQPQVEQAAQATSLQAVLAQEAELTQLAQAEAEADSSQQVAMPQAIQAAQAATVAVAVAVPTTQELQALVVTAFFIFTTKENKCLLSQ